MNLLSKTIQFISLKLRGVSFKSASLCFKQPLTAGDYYSLVMLACVAVIVVVLRFADWIDGIQNHAENMRVAAEYNQEVAIHHEATIASMLNGAVIINGRVVTMCQLTAAGECRK